MKTDPKKTGQRPPRLGAAQINLLERLCNACAVSGDEGEVRAIVLDQVRPYADELRVDVLGNVLATCRGRGEGCPRVMLAAHMDEVGFMLTYDDGDGIYRFGKVGGLDERQLVGKPVWIGHQHVPGVIGAKPVHLTDADERKRAIPLDALRIDTGPGGDAGVKVGDRAVFATPFTRLGSPGARRAVSLRAKALDNRLGVATLIELVRHAPPNLDLLAAFTVQEEIGLRGARVAEVSHYNTRLDGGPAIYLADGATISDPRLVRYLVGIAEEFKIPYQIRQPGGGGTDAGAIHRAVAGIPSVSVSVPGRYAHTAAGLARLSDWQNTFALLYAALTRLTPVVLAGER
jgi:putative aminopeptidase FrvX